MKIFLIISIFIYPISSTAHEFWIETHENFLSNQTISISAKAGSDGEGQSIKKIPGMVESLEVFYDNEPAGVQIKSRDNTHIFGNFKKNQASTYQAILKTRNFRSIISAKDFNQYLLDEHLENALHYRKENDLLETEGVELFSRIAKTILTNGMSNDYSRNFNLPFEISLISNPKFHTNNNQFKIKLTINGQPAPEKYVKAIYLTKNKNKNTIYSDKTDHEGIATFEIDDAGEWLFSSIKIELIGNEIAQWKSTWTSLTTTIEDNKNEK